jgi:hypothetical protein
VDLLNRLLRRIEDATINRIIVDMADIATPLKHFSDVVNSGDSRYFCLFMFVVQNIYFEPLNQGWARLET